MKITTTLTIDEIKERLEKRRRSRKLKAKKIVEKAREAIKRARQAE